MLKFIITSFIALFSLAAMAQERKIAIFDPAGNVNQAIKEIIREEMSSIIVNSKGYTVLERQMIDRVLEENRFQSGGLVDDTQVSEMGKRMGANYVFVSSITPVGNAMYYISCKLIDVQTARIEKQRTAQSSRSDIDLIAVVQKTMGEMFAETTNALLLLQTDRADNEKIAIFDPAGSVDNTYKEVVREEISSIIVNAGGYTVLERQLINKVLEENRFQSGGLVDDAQVSEMGKRMGANKVFVTSMTAMSGNNFYISCKLIDVETARIEKQRTGQTQSGANEMIGAVRKMAGAMFDVEVRFSEQPAQETRQTAVSVAAEKPDARAGMLAVKNRTVVQNNRELTISETQRLMANTDALSLYNKGLSENKKGNIFLISGLCLSAGGGLIAVMQPFEWRNHYTDKDGNRYYDYENEQRNNIVLGAVFGVAGALTMANGVNLKIKSKTSIRKSVNAYNRLKPTVGVELKFDFTGNGIRLALQF